MVEKLTIEYFCSAEWCRERGGHFAAGRRFGLVDMRSGLKAKYNRTLAAAHAFAEGSRRSFSLAGWCKRSAIRAFCVREVTCREWGLVPFRLAWNAAEGVRYSELPRSATGETSRHRKHGRGQGKAKPADQGQIVRPRLAK